MKDIYVRFKNFFYSEFGKGSLILIIMLGIYNIFNFLFHFTMGRILGPENYGILAVLMSLIYIYGVPSEAIQNLITKYTSKLNLNKKDGKIKYFMNKSLKKGLNISIFLFLVLIIFSFLLSSYLKISIFLILITNSVLFFSFSLPILRGILQGRKQFTSFGKSMIIESSLKLFFSISLVILGFKIYGAIIGILLGSLASFTFSLKFNKKIIKSKEEKENFDEIYKTSVPYFITTVVIIFMFSIDIILAKRFFSPELSGQYAVLSLLGKIVFFGTTPINKAMFPLTCETNECKKDTKSMFKKSLIMTLIFSLIIIIIYYFFPYFVVNLLYGKQYLSISPILFYSALALTFLSLANLNFIYGLSIDRIKKPGYLFLFLILQGILLYTFNNSLKEYIIIFMVSNIIIFICSFLFIRK